MFTKYARSKFRLVMLALLIVGCVAGLSHVAFAADAPAAGATPQGTSGIKIFYEALDIAVICILVCCSIGVVALAIDAMMHIKEQTIAPLETTEHVRSLINSRQFKELMDFTATDTTFVSQSINAGLRRAHLGYPAMREATESAIGDQTSTWFRRIELLNVIGNIGPLIGLLGTVLGMMIAFNELQARGGDAKPADLAGGISAALRHTFGGLAVAIPALVVFGFYRTRIDKITSKAALLSEELLESLRPEEKKTSVNVGGSEMAKPAPRRAAAPAQETV